MNSKRSEVAKKFVKQKALFSMLIPFIIYVFIFNYIPVAGWIMAFQNYNPVLGFKNSKWVGIDNFKLLFSDYDFWMAMRNTLSISIIKLFLTFVAAVTLALMINEVKNTFFKRSVQTISYLPHFISWVVAASIITTILSPETGILNSILKSLNIINQPIVWLGEGKYFWWILGISEVWKETGWNAIVYLSAMTAIDPQLYDAAAVDGASRLQRIRHITLPGISNIISILLILNTGWLLNAGFEQVLLLQNPLVEEYSQIIDTFVIKFGLSMYRYSYATAAGIFKSVVSILLIYATNKLAKRLNFSQVI
ncbi:ABC transporter permease [Caldicellulosiruptoraceae bacterium PP1]